MPFKCIHRSKKTLTKQLCLVFNRFGICSKLNHGKCDKRHYKKYITLCTKLANYNRNVQLNLISAFTFLVFNF